MKRAGWERLSPPGATCDAHWRHVSGWEIQHCGHQTANWPYHAVSPDGITPVVSHNGRGFPNLLAAMQAVELLLRGLAFFGGPEPNMARITPGRVVTVESVLAAFGRPMTDAIDRAFRLPRTA